MNVDPFLDDVLEGLSRPRKRLPSKYFYDAIGSKLFDRITALEEYYPTRTELSILRKHAAAMAARCGPNCALIELGAGSLTKVRWLLDRLVQPAAYLPVDVSGEHLQRAAKELANDYPKLDVRAVVADFAHPFVLPALPAERRVAYFPGSTIGNFDPPEADALLRRIVRLVGPGGGLLLGIDLQKDIGVLEAAYNDARGITAEFNRNLLARLHRELGADINIAAFRHRAFYNRELHRIEMHLVSMHEQRVTVGGRTFGFRNGETIHTENSYKCDLAEFGRRAAASGLRVDEVWTDSRRFFAVLYMTAIG